MKDELQRTRKEAAVVDLNYYPRIFLEGLKDTKKKRTGQGREENKPNSEYDADYQQLHCDFQ
jgi:hypothetical protein